jgi:hypothetical protein
VTADLTVDLSLNQTIHGVKVADVGFILSEQAGADMTGTFGSPILALTLTALPCERRVSFTSISESFDFLFGSRPIRAEGLMDCTTGSSCQARETNKMALNSP